MDTAPYHDVVDDGDFGFGGATAVHGRLARATAASDRLRNPPDTRAFDLRAVLCRSRRHTAVAGPST